MPRLAPSVPVSGLLQSRIRSQSHPVSGCLNVLRHRQAFAIFPGTSYAVIKFSIYFTTDRAGLSIIKSPERQGFRTDRHIAQIPLPQWVPAQVKSTLPGVTGIKKPPEKAAPARSQGRPPLNGFRLPEKPDEPFKPPTGCGFGGSPYASPSSPVT